MIVTSDDSMYMYMYMCSSSRHLLPSSFGGGELSVFYSVMIVGVSSSGVVRSFLLLYSCGSGGKTPGPFFFWPGAEQI